MDFFKTSIGQILDTCTKVATVSSPQRPEETGNSQLTPFFQIIRNKLEKLPEPEAEELCLEFIGMLNNKFNGKN